MRSGPASFGGIGFVFVFSALTAIIAAVAIAVRVREERPAHTPHATPSPDRTSSRRTRRLSRAARRATSPPTVASGRPRAPRCACSTGACIAAIVLNVGGYYGGGTYEVIWSLFLERLGADLALIGLTFAMFGLPVLVLSPFAGRLVDRRGSFAFIVLGMVLPAVTGILYTFIADPVLAVPLILIEATGFAFLNPALYASWRRARRSGRSRPPRACSVPPGPSGSSSPRSTTGVLAERSILLPFYAFSVVMLVRSSWPSRSADRRCAAAPPSRSRRPLTAA